jgi:hypothetical protein
MEISKENEILETLGIHSWVYPDPNDLSNLYDRDLLSWRYVAQRRICLICFKEEIANCFGTIVESWNSVTEPEPELINYVLGRIKGMGKPVFIKYE